jgi:hypothetical protein
MEFKGTKGKWRVCEKHETIIDENGYGIAQIHGIINEKEWKANALLISKSPEMLEMLKDIVVRFEDNDRLSMMEISILNDCKQLIKEATTI